MLCLEDGVMCDPEEFWRQRQGPEWDDGWEIKSATPIICTMGHFGFDC